MKKPSTSEKVVFERGSTTIDRARRIKRGATLVLDSLTMPGHMKRDRNDREQQAENRAATRLSTANSALRERFDDVLGDGVVLHTQNRNGSSITATGMKRDEKVVENTIWNIEVRSAKGHVTKFATQVATQYPGSEAHERNYTQVSLINPETGKAYDRYRYDSHDVVQAYGTLATALEQLTIAQDRGTLAVTPIPPAVISQQAPQIV